jgi:acetylornithine/N-succinyldiaminopimelate aminotransferase
MTEGALREREAAVLMGTYARQPVNLVSGRGVWVRDSDAREYIDLVGGLAVNVLGHAHPAVHRALAMQSQQLVHASNLYYTEPQVALAETLVSTAFESRVFLCNSGAEANEAAIKLARKWGRVHRGGAGRIICAEGAFHGRTTGALAVTGTPAYREQFEPLLPGVTRVAYNDVDAIASAISDDTCAVLLEPIQGESGVIPLDPGVLAQIRALCDERGILLILDEVQTGMGRTGAWWAHQHEGITPDVMTVAKGLAGGVPIGAVLAAPRADVFEPGDHGSTFGGNPLACAVGLAVLRTIDEEHLVERALSGGDHFTELISELAERGAPIGGVRGRGLMLGVALSAPVARSVAAAALQQGLIVNAVGDTTIRLLPPLIISRDEIEEAMRRLGNAFAAVGSD